MIKFLLTSIAVIFLVRMLLRLLTGGFHVKVEKHYYYHDNRKQETQKPEGFTTITQNTTQGKQNKYSETEGEYVPYEEVKE
ncbi:MAG: hypothetical protein IT247_02370 [Bacteroidia bacterium]|nr:hypothetical protein [Bacteroidia bacterium]